MTHALRFHVLTLPNVPWPEVERRFRHIEELGFDVAGVADHFIRLDQSVEPVVRGVDPPGGGGEGDFRAPAVDAGDPDSRSGAPPSSRIRR
jgi:hypothetical protein